MLGHEKSCQEMVSSGVIHFVLGHQGLWKDEFDNIIKATFYPRKMGGLALQNFHPMSLLQPFVGTISNSLFEGMTCNVKPSIPTGGGSRGTHRGHTDDLLTHNLFIYSNTQLFTNPPITFIAAFIIKHKTHVLFVSSLLNF